MKTLLIIGVLLTLAGATLANNVGVSGSWIFQTGLIFLLGALAVSRKEKIWTLSGLFFMVSLFLWGFVNGIWYAHPLGAIMSIVGGGWVIYHITRNKEYQMGNLRAPLTQEFSKKILPNVKQYIKWVSIPLGILLSLWLSKSILIAFVVGFGITAFLDKQSIQAKGLNRVAVVLLLYTIGFFILLMGTFKIDVAINFYPNKLKFFTFDSYVFLRDITRGL